MTDPCLSAWSLLRRARACAAAAIIVTAALTGASGAAFAAARTAAETAPDPTCPSAAAGGKQLLFGDLHVHTSYSLDAYAFGSVATPKEAYAFARGQPLRLADGSMIEIDRPLDFAAVTDHADTFEITYSCTDPIYSDAAYCKEMRALQAAGKGPQVFTDFLLPVVVTEPPVHAPICESLDCEAAYLGQWRRTVFAANAANDPCEFTALIGYEWTATPGGRHWHRNVIYRSGKVPGEAFDYIRYPTVGALWQALAEHCRVEDGCDAVAIPHNINWTDGGTFDVENDSPEISALRARYERLAEIHQEKGASECLPESAETVSPDCDFELLKVNSAKLRISGPDSDPVAAWQAMRSGYYRSLLGRGLLAFEDSGRIRNPLKLGAIGSTDGHFGAPGFTAEASYPGGVAALWVDEEARLANPLYNPGGLVAVWAEQNTRAGVFDALKRREAYATSGTRIRLKFGTTAERACEAETIAFEAPMGSTLTRPGSRTFTVQVARDRVDLASIDIVKGALEDGEPVETVHRIAEFAPGRATACLTWTDPDPGNEPAYWYARVLEQPSPRWSKLTCERLELCDKYPDADRMIQERAWSSPVWYLPGSEGSD